MKKSKQQKREEAIARQQAYSALTPEEKLNKAHPGTKEFKLLQELVKRRKAVRAGRE